MLRASATICLLFVSNIFMTWAWYGHLKKFAWTLPVAIGLSWLIALPEYTLQVPANRLGHYQHGGPFTLDPTNHVETVSCVNGIDVGRTRRTKHGTIAGRHAPGGMGCRVAIREVGFSFDNHAPDHRPTDA